MSRDHRPRRGIGPTWIRLLITAYLFYLSQGGDYAIRLHGDYDICDPGEGALLTGVYTSVNQPPLESLGELPPHREVRFLAAVARYGVSGHWVLGKSQNRGAAHEKVVAGDSWFILDMRDGTFHTFESKGQWQTAIVARRIPGTTVLMYPDVPFFHEMFPSLFVVITVPLALWLWLGVRRPRSGRTGPLRWRDVDLSRSSPAARRADEAGQEPAATERPQPSAAPRNLWRVAGATLGASVALILFFAAISPAFHAAPPGWVPALGVVVPISGPLCWVLDAGFSGLAVLPLVQSMPLVLSSVYLLIEGVTKRSWWKCALAPVLWTACSFFPTLALAG